MKGPSTASQLEAGVDHGDHLVQPPNSTDGETEAQDDQQLTVPPPNCFLPRGCVLVVRKGIGLDPGTHFHLPL